MNIKTAQKRKKKQRLAQEIARVRTIIDGIARRPFRRSDKIGFDAEDEVLSHAEYFKKNKIVQATKLSERFSPDDQMGRDLTIELIGGKTIYIQITAFYHRENEAKSYMQGNYYLAVYPGENKELTREKLRMIILDGYFADLGAGQIRETLKMVDGLKQAPVKPKKFWQFFRRD